MEWGHRGECVSPLHSGGCLLELVQQEWIESWETSEELSARHPDRRHKGQQMSNEDFKQQSHVGFVHYLFNSSAFYFCSMISPSDYNIFPPTHTQVVSALTAPPTDAPALRYCCLYRFLESILHSGCFCALLKRSALRFLLSRPLESVRFVHSHNPEL